MVEGTGLENRHTGEPGIESSNLSLSVLRIFSAYAGVFVAVRSVRKSKFVDGWRHKTMSGRVAEWFKAHAWKVCVR